MQSNVQAVTTEPKRGRVLSTFAVLFVLLAISNLLKPFRFGGSDTGFVFFGQRLSGTANAIVGPLFGIYLLVYAFGVWRMKRYALPMAYAYAGYVIINLILFNMRNPVPPGVGYLIFGVVYSGIAIGVSSGAAYLLSKRKAALG
ncbi:MAG: hypothetical protein ACHQ9S_13605 [Candidatus Binatia bacterium]